MFRLVLLLSWWLLEVSIDSFELGTNLLVQDRKTHFQRKSKLRSGCLAATTPPENSDEKDESETKEKPMSPLAMAAADWLEEEEDELATYWDRFEDAKRGDRNKSESTSSESLDQVSSTSSTVSTEELLDRYYEGQGIDKRMEQKFKSTIEEAIESATKASSASQAVRILEDVSQYFQYNTKTGGNAWLELAQAYDANEESEKAREIYTKLLSNPQINIRRRAKELLLSNSSNSRRQYGKNNFWNFFDDWRS
mmetsp:Transcript_10823/g.15263  ORF Transcript_10823/g.15263 Transcript_10823/m.15263 type:complete len:252 (-) Transcript_10823:56-811(-)